MENTKIDNLELFFDCLNESNNFLYEIYHKPYFELIEMTVNNILNGEIMQDFEDESQEEELQKIYDKIKDVDFTVEDVRKAMQAIVLRGLIEMRIPNGNTTPDTLGIFISYLITKVIDTKKISILDPLCGTGNLLLTIVNHLDRELELYACDNDLWMSKITALTADLLGAPVNIYYQDTMTLNLKDIDAIIFDMPHSEYKDNEYFPYKAMLHYKDMISKDGVMVAIVENDFFDYDKNQEFKKELLKQMTILGLVELPDSMFKTTKPKIILLLQNAVIENKKCFMVKLPSFTNVKEFNESLMEIETWFEKNNYNKKK